MMCFDLFVNVLLVVIVHYCNSRVFQGTVTETIKLSCNIKNEWFIIGNFFIFLPSSFSFIKPNSSALNNMN